MTSIPIRCLFIIWFSDEAHFYLNAQYNRQNCRFGATKKADFHLEKPLHDERVTVWAAFSGVGIMGPFFFEDDTVNKYSYLSILKKKFIPALRRKGFNINDVWFQQDGAMPHTARDVLD